MEGTVRALFVAPEKKAGLHPLREVQVGKAGFEGDFHARIEDPRQILMISNAVLEEFELEAGMLRENMVVDGLDVMTLREGQRLKIGDTVLEVTIPCDPCGQMNRLRSGLKHALIGRRGMFAKVITAGTIRIGDPVSI